MLFTWAEKDDGQNEHDQGYQSAYYGAANVCWLSSDFWNWDCIHNRDRLSIHMI